MPKGKTDQTKLCGAFGGRRRDGQPCGRYSGWNTDHPGTGKCGPCGRESASRGTKPGAPLKHGRYSQTLKARTEQIKHSGQMMNMKDIAAEFQAQYEGMRDHVDHLIQMGEVPTLKEREALLAILDRQANNIARIETMRKDNAYTVFEQQVLQQRFLAVACYLIPGFADDPQARADAIAMLAGQIPIPTTPRQSAPALPEAFPLHSDTERNNIH